MKNYNIEDTVKITTIQYAKDTLKMSFSEIGRELKISKQRAHQLYWKDRFAPISIEDLLD